MLESLPEGWYKVQNELLVSPVLVDYHGNSSCTIEWPSGSSGGLVEAMPAASGLGSLTRCLEMRICISFEVLGDARVQKMFIFVVIL